MKCDEFLQHWGIMGMRWGKRKSKTTVDIKRKSSQDHAAKELLKRKKVNEMSNAEIKKLNERLQLERQYKELTRVEKSAAHKFVTEMLSTTAKQAVTTYLNKQTAALMKKIVK